MQYRLNQQETVPMSTFGGRPDPAGSGASDGLFQVGWLPVDSVVVRGIAFGLVRHCPASTHEPLRTDDAESSAAPAAATVDASRPAVRLDTARARSPERKSRPHETCGIEKRRSVPETLLITLIPYSC